MFWVIVAIIIASIIVITKIPTKLGLDLVGGSRIMLEAKTTKSVTKITPDTMNRLQTAIEKRVNKLGVSETSVAQVGDKRLLVEIPGVMDSKEYDTLDVDFIQIQYDIEKEFLDKWQLPYPEYQQRFDALCACEVFYVFDLFYKNTRGKMRNDVLQYDWTLFLSKETLASLQNNPFLNETHKMLWKWIEDKNYISLKNYFFKKQIRKKLKKLKA